MKPHARDVHRVRLTPYRGPGGSKGGADPPSADADLADVYDRIAALEGVASTALPPGLAVLSGQLGGPAGLHGDYDPSRLAALPPGAARLSLGFASALATAGPGRGMRVLDVGCGGGLDLALARHAVGPQGAIAGLDASPGMLERARGVVEAPPTPDLRLGDAAALPWDTGSFDRIVMNCSLSLLPDREAALGEARRVGAVGARLAIADVAIGASAPPELRRALEGWGSGVPGRLEASTLGEELRGVGWSILQSESSSLEPAALWTLAEVAGADLRDPVQRRVLAPWIRALSRDLHRLTVLAVRA